MEKLSEITAAMRRYNQERAPGSECTEWGDYVADCFRVLGVAPWDDDADEIDTADVFDADANTAADVFAEYWLRVAGETA